MLHGMILLANIVLGFLCSDSLLCAIGFRHQFLPEIVIECQIEQRAVHVQQNGIDVLPGNINMHGNSPDEIAAKSWRLLPDMRYRVAYRELSDEAFRGGDQLWIQAVFIIFLNFRHTGAVTLITSERLNAVVSGAAQHGEHQQRRAKVAP